MCRVDQREGLQGNKCDPLEPVICFGLWYVPAYENQDHCLCFQREVAVPSDVNGNLENNIAWLLPTCSAEICTLDQMLMIEEIRDEE